LRSNGLYLELSILKNNNGRLEGQYYKQLANLGGESGLPPVLIKKIMTLYYKNIETIKKHGFENMNFSGYGGTGYKKGDLQIWWGEWGYAYIETWGRPERAEIQLGQISTDDISDKLKQALIDIEL
jgi:hypothetical protein